MFHGHEEATRLGTEGKGSGATLDFAAFERARSRRIPSDRPAFYIHPPQNVGIRIPDRALSEEIRIGRDVLDHADTAPTLQPPSR
jgi:hypothetical protein